MISLASRLARARLTTNRSSLDVLAVVAFTVSTWLALTVAGGTWMFVGRAGEPPQQFIDAVLADLPRQVEVNESLYSSYSEIYIYLALVACSLLVVPILTLGGAAARLGASGRSRRLASLRLLGMTSSEVVLMSLIESLFLALTGAVLGSILFAASLPAWHAVTFLGEPLHPGELVLPWWLYALVILVVIAIACLSTLTGLRRVRISPLGVAKRETPPALKFWRLGLLVALIGGFAIVSATFDPERADTMGWVIVAIVISTIVFAVNLAGPFLIQLLAKLSSHGSSPARMLAMKRIAFSPKDAWRSVAAMAFIGFIAGFMSRLSAAEAGDGNPLGQILSGDVFTGVIITIIIGMILAATSTLINQASSTVDRGRQLIALTRMGTPIQVFRRARTIQVIVPLATVLILSTGLGLFVSKPLSTEADGIGYQVQMVAVLVAGAMLTLLASFACRPIENAIVESDYRPND